MAPVIRALQQDDAFEPIIVATGQHKELLSNALVEAGIRADEQWGVMTEGQSLGLLTSRLLTRFDDHIRSSRPQIIVAQGDTTSVMCAAMSSFYNHIDFAHVEAGLRTPDVRSPFPEEFNRRTISLVTTLHFAPTERAASALIAEGIPTSRVTITGNTIIDELRRVRTAGLEMPSELAGRRSILLTLHRRENFGKPFEDVLAGLRDVLNELSDLVLIFPVHPNPQAREPAYRLLGDLDRVKLLPPLSHRDLAAYLQYVSLIVTDSGGLQEEAPYFGKPVLVARTETERPEAIEAGIAKLVGTSRTHVRDSVLELFHDQAIYNRMSEGGSPFGDGRAAERILESLRQHFSH